MHRIDDLYLDNSSPEKAYRLETYRSTGAISSTISQQLRCYFVTRCAFPSEPAKKTQQGTTEIRSVSDASFLEKASDNTLEVYQSVMDQVEKREGPVIEMFEVEDSRERRIVIGFKYVLDCPLPGLQLIKQDGRHQEVLLRPLGPVPLLWPLVSTPKSPLIVVLMVQLG